MKRPLADKRPIGPFAQPTRAHGPAEVNIFFSFKNLSPGTVEQVDEAIEDLSSFQGPAGGIHGVQDNVVSIQTVGNQTTFDELNSLMNEVEESTGIDVEDIEVIW